MITSRRLLCALALSAWFVCSGLAWLVAERHADRIERQAEAAALARAEVGAEAIEQSLLRMLEAIDGLQDLAQARQRLIEAGDRSGTEAIQAQLATVARTGRFGVLQVAIIGAGGWLTWSSVQGWQPVQLSDREHFRVHRDGERDRFISAPLVGRASGQWSIQVTRPLLDRTGGFAGVVVVSVNSVELSRDLARLDFGAGATSLVLRRDGIVLARSWNPEEVLGQSVGPSWRLMAALADAPAGRFDVRESAFDSRRKLVGYRTVEGAPLVVSVALDARRELAPTGFARPALRAAAAAISLLALAVIALALLWMERRRTQASLERARRERETALERLAHAQRMEALGRLAGGVAHDFNNVMQAVLGGARLIQRRPGDAIAVERLARMLAEAAERGAAVTRRLLAFARRGELRAEAVEVKALFAGLQEVLGHTLGANIQVRTMAAAGLPGLLADRAQLETVLVNLAVNARDAMAPDGGTLTIAAAAEAIAAGRNGGGLAPGTYVRLAVSDTGPGMDATTLARAGEPFFTTKPKGEGTGLGLAMAKGFAEQSGGVLRIENLPERGLRVTLWLPQVAAGVAQEARPAEDPAPAAPRSGARVLLVDDEPQVRAVLAAALRECGHAVEEASSGEMALARLGRAGGFDVLVSDLSMPGMSGIELIRQARKRRPGLPAVLVTGYAGDADAGQVAVAADAGPLLLLRKPIDPDELADRVAAMAQPAGAGA